MLGEMFKDMLRLFGYDNETYTAEEVGMIKKLAMKYCSYRKGGSLECNEDDMRNLKSGLERFAGFFKNEIAELEQDISGRFK